MRALDKSFAPLSLFAFGAVLAEGGGRAGGVWAAAAALLLAAGAAVLAGRRLPFSRYPMTVPFAGLLWWGLLSALASSCAYPSFLSYTELAAASAFGVLALAAWEPVHRRVFTGLLVSVGALQSLFVLVSRLFARPLLLIFPGNNQYAALWMCAGALVVLGAAFSPKRGRAFQAACGFLAAQLAAAVFLLPSRSGLAALLAGLAFFAGRQFGRRGILALGLGAVLFFSLVPQRTWQGVLKIQDSLAWRRLDIWRTAVEGIREKPVLGWGPGQFGVLHQRHATPQDLWPVRLRITTSYAHNDYLQAASEYGLAGAALLLAGLFLLFFRHRPQESGETGPMAALASVAVFCLSNFPLALPANALLAAGLLGGLPPAAAGPAFKERGLGAATAALWGVLALLNAVDAAAYAGRFLGKESWARRLNPWNAEPLVRQADGLLHPAGTPLPDAAPRARDLLVLAVSRCPSNVAAWRQLAHVYAAHRQPPLLPEAEQALRSAAAWYPTNALIHMELSDVLRSQGKREEALAAAHRALELEPHYAQAALQVGALIRLGGEPERAERWLRAALRRAETARLPGPLPPYPEAILQVREDLFREEIALCRKAFRRKRA